jgi:hypothetical protein
MMSSAGGFDDLKTPLLRDRERPEMRDNHRFELFQRPGPWERQRPASAGVLKKKPPAIGCNQLDFNLASSRGTRQFQNKVPLAACDPFSDSQLRTPPAFFLSDAQPWAARPTMTLTYET